MLSRRRWLGSAPSPRLLWFGPPDVDDGLRRARGLDVPERHLHHFRRPLAGWTLDDFALPNVVVSTRQLSSSIPSEKGGPNVLHPLRNGLVDLEVGGFD